MVRFFSASTSAASSMTVPRPILMRMPRGPSAEENRRVDEIGGFVGAGDNDDESVDRYGHLVEVGVVAVRNVGARPAGVVDDVDPHGLETARDRHADAPEPNDADGAVAKRRRQRVVAVALPAPGAEIAFGGTELAHGRQEERQSRVRSLLGEDVGRVGDDNIALGRAFEVDTVIADPRSWR